MAPRTPALHVLRFLAAIATGLAFTACGDTARPPHLVLILVDTLRPDHLGCYGYARPTSPHIDALAARGVLFETARSTSSWTKPAVASLFTSRLPSEHSAVSIKRNLPDSLPTLAEALRDAGYLTVGVSGNFVHVRGTAGFAQGFDEWFDHPVALDERGDAIWSVDDPQGETVHLRARTGPELNREVRARLPEADEERPLFLYVHYMEPHAGYDPPEPFRSAFADDVEGELQRATSDYVIELAAGERDPEPGERERLIDLYDAEIAAVDASIADLLALLEERGIARDAVVAIVSDHGEEFLEHGRWTHAISLHEETLRVPLVISDLRRPGGGRRVSDPVDLLDVAPTLLALAGVAPDPAMRGRPLLAPGPLARADSVAELHRDVFVEDRLGARDQHLAFVRGAIKAIFPWQGSARYYRLDLDPLERQPLAPNDERLDAAFVAAATRVAELLPPDPGDGEAVPLDPRTLEGLRALGYAE